MAIIAQRALQRVINIAKLDIPTYEEVEADGSATGEAAAVVVATAIIGSIGSLFVNGLWGFIAWMIILLVGWFIWAWCCAFIAQKMFGVTTTDVGEMLRTTGYATGPRVLGIIPFLGLIAAIWSLVCVVVGVRQAGELTTVQAIITAVVGWLPTIIGIAIVSAVLT